MLANEGLLNAIEEGFKEAKEALSANKVSTSMEIEKLQAKLDGIWNCLKQQGFAESTGLASELCPSYVIMQGIIESAADQLSWNTLEPVSAFIVMPHMPNPLMFSEGKGLQKIDLSNPLACELYRNITLVELITGGAVVHAVYSHNAKTALSNQEGLDNYAAYLKQYEKLHDHPKVTIDMANFPSNITGAMYFIDGAPIVIESCQVDDSKPSTWAIRIGDSAKIRVAEVNGFLKENGASDLGM